MQKEFQSSRERLKTKFVLKIETQKKWSLVSLKISRKPLKGFKSESDEKECFFLKVVVKTK